MYDMFSCFYFNFHRVFIHNIDQMLFTLSFLHTYLLCFCENGKKNVLRLFYFPWTCVQKKYNCVETNSTRFAVYLFNNFFLSFIFMSLVISLSEIKYSPINDKHIATVREIFLPFCKAILPVFFFLMCCVNLWKVPVMKITFRGEADWEFF